MSPARPPETERLARPAAMAGGGQDVFLSSAFRGFMKERQRIRDLDAKRIWMVEDQRPDLDQRKGPSPFFIVDELVAQIRQSSLFVCVLRDVYGSSVFGAAESVSFLETEIYQAALFHNNIRFFLMEPFNPPEKLKGLLDLVRTLRPGVIPERAYPESVVLDQIKHALDASPAKRRPWAVSVRRLVGQLALQRGHPRSDLEFFDHVFSPVSARPDKDHVAELLAGLAGETSIERRLTRMWIALRELSAAPYDEPRSAEYLKLWNDALGAWASAAAWYGLHGHLYAGRLAAVNSALKIRALPGWARFRPESGSIHSSKGGRASEYYSIAKLMPGSAQRALYLNLALADVQDALANLEGNASGFLSIRGHIYRMQGRLHDALADFERMKAFCEQSSEPGAIGEALSDMGVIEMALGRSRAAATHLREGADLLKAAGNHPFVIRAQKRLALGFLRSGHPMRALKELLEAYEIAQEYQIYAQVTPLMEMVHMLVHRLGVWPRKRR